MELVNYIEKRLNELYIANLSDCLAPLDAMQADTSISKRRRNQLARTRLGVAQKIAQLGG